MAAGRPTKYDPKYCEMLIEHRSQGFSMESFAAKIGVNRDTLLEWARVHPEFSGAKKDAIDKCQAFHEDFIMRHTVLPKDVKFNAAPYIFMLKNVLGWTDRSEQVVKTDGKEISITYKNGDKSITSSMEVPDKQD